MTDLEPRLRSIFRIMAAYTFWLHGLQKTFGAFGALGGFKPPLSSLLGVAGLLETVLGALIIVGLFTRPVAFVLAGEMAVAYFRTHAPRGFWPISNGGEITVFYCFFFLWLSAAGAGSWSLDQLLRKKK